MASVFYILYSSKLDRYYSGISTLSANERLNNHLSKKYSSLNFTAKSDDWKLVLEINCIDYSHARKIELHIKKMKSKKYIQNLINSPEMKNFIFEKFKSI